MFGNDCLSICVIQHVEKLFVSNVFRYVGLFDAFRTDFRLLFLVRDVEGVHFCSKTDEFSRGTDPVSVSLLNLPRTRLFVFE